MDLLMKNFLLTILKRSLSAIGLIDELALKQGKRLTSVFMEMKLGLIQKNTQIL